MKVLKSSILEIEMDLTGTCNLKCPLCTRNYSHAQHMLYYDERSIGTITAQLDQYPNLKRFYLAGAVSEPTLYKDFYKFIEYLNSRDVYIEVYTNGSTHTPEWWKKLGEILKPTDKINFTICGSTQELHEKYRVGSSLAMIRENAKAFRNNNKNDYVQYIKFDYNAHDEYSDGMKAIYEEFSNHYTVETEGVRRLTEKERDPGEGVEPTEWRDKTIKKLFDNRPKPDDGKEYQLICKSLQDHKVHINQSGKVSACYIHAEFEPQHTFDDEVMDYTGILEFNYPDCFLCEKRTRMFIEKLGLNFVC